MGEYEIKDTDGTEEWAKRKGRESKYPWRKIEVGQYFEVPVPEGKTAREMHGILNFRPDRCGPGMEGWRFSVHYIREENVMRVLRTA